MRPSLFWKIFGSSLALIVLTTVVAGFVAERRIIEDVERETRESLRTRVELITAAVRDRLPAAYDEAFQREVRVLGERTATRITLLRADGYVLADSSKDPLAMDNHSTRPEVLASRTAEFGASTRFSDTLSMRMVYVAYALRDGDGAIRAHVRAALPLLRLEERLSGLRGMLLGGAGLAVILGLIAAFLIARRLTRPLRDVTEAVRAIAGGDLQRRAAVNSRDEVGDLGRHFNHMAELLEREVAKIRHDRRELLAILGSMAEGVLAVDADDRAVLVNDAAREMLQIEAGAVEGHPLHESLRLPVIDDALAAAKQAEGTRTAVLRPAQGGTERALRLHTSAIRGDENEYRGAVLVIDDITEREQIEAMRRDFIANASHELKTPIASVRGLAETILGDQDMEATTRTGFIQRIMRQAARLGDLVEDMLALSRLECEAEPPSRQATDLRTPLLEVIETAGPLAAEHGVRIEHDVPGEPVLVRAEPESVHRIASNLLENAIKYSGPGSRVSVQLRVTEGGVVLEVRDDGVGIPRDKHERIFERFYRVDEHRSRRLGGTGLGLAIVKHLVQAHDGRIELESAPGAGSTFRVVFLAA